ncbi:MAG: TonB-dependent receptor, partial [Acidobacteria bacterium]|nr:TonB-dependent receptor [Acidobacteriota bacterium]
MKTSRILATVFCLCLTALVAAQVNTGRINGVVTDNSGAMVTNATVTAINPETGVAQPIKTNEAGEFNFPFLPPAPYVIKVEAPGFSTEQRKNVVLAVGQVLTLNFGLKPGASSEVIEVTGETPLVETSRSDIGGNVTPAEARDLPVRDRNFSSLMVLVPGVRPATNFDPTKSRSGNASVNGGDGRSFDYNVDGGDDKDNVIGGIVQNFTLEGIQEFNVVTDRYTAESGRTVGGVVNVVSKSGTNSLHGSAFGEMQNSYFNANSKLNLDANGNQLPKENFHRYHAGGSFGGPIIKDKLFFFGAYEYKRELVKEHPDSTAVANLDLVPFASPAAVVPNPFYQQLATIKLDWKPSDRQALFARYGRDRWITPNDQPASSGGPIADLSESTANRNQFHSLVLSDTFTVSNTKVNSVSVQFQDFVNAIVATPARTFTLAVAGGGTAVNPLITFPSAELGNNINVPQETLIRKWQLRDDFSWVKGRHSQKFGANAVYLSRLGGSFFSGLGYQLKFFDNPVDIFGSKAASYPQGLATPGAVSEIIYSAGDGSTNNPQQPTFVGLYYQDDFKATPHLTLNLGLRWDASIDFLNPQLTNDPLTSNRVVDILRQVVEANPQGPGTAAGLARAQYLAGNVSQLRRKTADWKEFQPRLGFAWDPTGSGNWVVRGGFGIARDQIFQNLTLWSIQQSNPTLYQSGLIDIGGSGSSPSSATGATGPLATYRFGVDPLPAPTGAATDLAPGAR